MSRTLWQKSTYTARIEYIIDMNIREFDISKANISVLRDANVLTEEEYQYYIHAPRMERQVAIGKLQGRNPEISEILKSGIKNAKKVFMEANSIDDSDILFIRNDAITIVGNKVIKTLQVTNHVCFRLVASYTSFYKFKHMDFLYFYDPVINSEHLDVKGLGDEGVELHKKYMLDFLCELFYRAQREGIKEGIVLLQSFYKTYVNRNLDIGYYREINPISRYRLLPSFSGNTSLFIDHASAYHKSVVDIGYNEAFLRHFMRIYSTIYFK